MNKIRMYDGSEYDVEFCAPSDGVLAMRIPHAFDLTTAAQTFDKPDATRKITYLYSNPMVPDQPIVLAVYEGYTDLIGILIDRNSRRPLIQLQKEERNAT